MRGGFQKKLGEGAEFGGEIQERRPRVMGRLKMKCLCLEGEWVDTQE